MTFEVFSMGLLSKIFRNLENSTAKKGIAKHFNLPNPYILESWMHSMTYVRNLCAHHSRLWNRTLTLKPQLLKKPKNPWLSSNNINPNKLFAFLSCSLYLLRVINQPEHPNRNTSVNFLRNTLTPTSKQWVFHQTGSKKNCRSDTPRKSNRVDGRRP